MQLQAMKEKVGEGSMIEEVRRPSCGHENTLVMDLIMKVMVVPIVK
jgi:hypothetical protein